MPPNTYTWKCPRCKFTQTSTSPAPPDNCPRCNYPDQDTRGETANDPNEELEAEVGPEAALDPTHEPPADVTTRQPTGIERLAEMIEPRKIDRGWLAECMREVVGKYLNDLPVHEVDVGDDPKLGDIIDAMALDWPGATGAVLDMYEGDRPTLICGCPAGYHPSAFEEITRAHPDRKWA